MSKEQQPQMTNDKTTEQPIPDDFIDAGQRFRRLHYAHVAHYQAWDCAIRWAYRYLHSLPPSSPQTSIDTIIDKLKQKSNLTSYTDPYWLGRTHGIDEAVRMLTDMFRSTRQNNKTIDNKWPSKSTLPSSPVGEAGLKWVKASERKPVVFAEEVIVRSLVTGRVRKTQNMGHNTGWDIGLDWHYKWENTEWLDESPSPSRAGEPKDDFVKGYACALVCIIQGHGISTEVEDAYKAGLKPIKQLKGIIDDFDYSILKKHFK